MGSGLQRVAGPSDDGSDLPLQAGREIRILRTAVRCGTLVSLVSRSCLVRTSRQTARYLTEGWLRLERVSGGGIKALCRGTGEEWEFGYSKAACGDCPARGWCYQW